MLIFIKIREDKLVRLPNACLFFAHATPRYFWFWKTFTRHLNSQYLKSFTCTKEQLPNTAPFRRVLKVILIFFERISYRVFVWWTVLVYWFCQDYFREIFHIDSIILKHFKAFQASNYCINVAPPNRFTYIKLQIFDKANSFLENVWNVFNREKGRSHIWRSGYLFSSSLVRSSKKYNQGEEAI